MSFNTIEYVVAERPQYPNTLRIHRDGWAQALLRFSGGANSTGEIGYFEWKLGPADVSELDRLVSSDAFRRAPDDTGQLLPGSSHRIIRVQDPPGAVEKVVQWENTPQAGLGGVLSTLERHLGQAGSGPRRVLRVQLGPLTFDAGGVVSAILTLDNPGSQPVRIRSPLAMRPDSGAGLELEAWPDRAGVSAHDVVRAPIVRVEKASPRNEQDVIDVQPRESYVYRVYAAPVWATRGPHQVRLRYNSPTVGLAPEELSGEVYTRIAAISVP